MKAIAINDFDFFIEVLSQLKSNNKIIGISRLGISRPGLSALGISGVNLLFHGLRIQKFNSGFL